MNSTMIIKLRKQPTNLSRPKCETIELGLEMTGNRRVSNISTLLPIQELTQKVQPYYQDQISEPTLSTDFLIMLHQLIAEEAEQTYIYFYPIPR